MADDYNLRAAKGQAFNLAVNRSVAEGKADDVKVVYGYFIHYYELGQLLQSAPVDDIKKVLAE